MLNPLVPAVQPRFRTTSSAERTRNVSPARNTGHASHDDNGRELRLEFHVLTRTKQPAAERHRVSIDDQRIDRTRSIVRHVWRAIESGHSLSGTLAQRLRVVPLP